MKRFVSLSIVFAAIAVGGKAQEWTDPYAFIRDTPIELHRPFCSILQHGIGLQKQRDWAGFYELLLPANRSNKSSEQYVKSKGDRDFILKEFKVSRIDVTLNPGSPSKNGIWTIVGCAVVQEKGKTISRESATTVYLDNSNWYMDTVGLLVPLDSTSPQVCKIGRAIAISDFCKP